MIQVLLLILKIIGITLLAILGLVLLVLLLVLFVPIFYWVRIIHNPEQTKVTGRVSFLFPLLLVTFQYLKKISYKIRVFGFALLDSEKPKKEKAKKEKKIKKKKNEKPAEVPTSEETFWEPLTGKTEESVEEEATDSPAESQAEPQTKPYTETEAEPETKKTSIFAKIRCKLQKVRETISNIIQKVKKLLHQKDEVQRILSEPETKRALAFVWKELKHLLKHILPRKIKGYVAYGADNPATTGQALGVLSILYARTGRLLEIRPNFEEKQLECDVMVKGRIQVFTLLVIAIKVFLNQELRQLIGEFKGLKEIE